MVVKVAMPQQFKLKVVPSLKGLLFPNQKEVHYIGGSEVLPPPLETERETEVIRRLGSEYDQEAKKMLIEHNLRLVVYIAKKFDNTGVGVEDQSTHSIQPKRSSLRPMHPDVLKMKS